MKSKLRVEPLLVGVLLVSVAHCFVHGLLDGIGWFVILVLGLKVLHAKGIVV